MTEILNTVKAGSTAWLTVTFTDKDGNPAIPINVTYDVVCLTNRSIVQADASVTPGESVEITLDPTDTGIIYAGHTKEHRRVVVTATYGTDDQIVETADFLVANPNR